MSPIMIGICCLSAVLVIVIILNVIVDKKKKIKETNAHDERSVIKKSDKQATSVTFTVTVSCN